MARTLLGASLLLAGFVALPARSAAEPGAALVVVPDDAEPPVSLVRSLGGRQMKRTAAWRAIADARARDRLDKGRQVAKAGRRAVTKLRLEQAKTALREALDHFAAAQQLPETCREAYAAARDLSFLRWQRKKLEPARRWRAAAAGLSKPAIDPTRYPPEFIAFWNESDENPAPTPITIAVKGRPAPASAPASAPTSEQVDVWVNCKTVGKAPAAVSVSGAALVALHSGPRAASALVEPARSELHEIALAPAEKGAMSDEEAAALLRATGTSQLYWVRRDERWVIDRFRQKGGWKQAFRRFDPKPATTVTIRERPADPTPSEGAPALGWVLTGSAAGALVAGVVTAALARSAADEIERKAAAEEVFDPADQEDNRRYRTVSYATLAVGGALAAGAIVYWLLRWRRRPAARGVPGRSAPARGVAPLLPSARTGFRFQGPELVIGW